MSATVAETWVGLKKPGRRAVGIWLVAVALIILGMVTLGGLTRLTGSGLSITEWQPVSGVLPPLTDHAWQSAFAKYQHIPQYARENRWMKLADFKAIFWWEWTHRLLGRLLGVVFFLPFLFFAWTGAITRKDLPRLLLLFALGGFQGFIGWWMVQSGLETRVSVSQYRLAIHLGTAVVLLGAILWVALDYLSEEGGQRKRTRDQSAVALGFVGLVYVQMLLGALVAGLHAGLIYNSWPSMDGRFAPEAPFFAKPWWINFFENPGLAQFDHRIGAYVVALASIYVWFQGRRAPARVRMSANAVLVTTLAQVALGIVTLLAQAPLALAALHQLTAALLFCAAVWHAFETSRVAARP
jgi:cytochrome c oxidase assembly protein subunit 15